MNPPQNPRGRGARAGGGGRCSGCRRCIGPRARSRPRAAPDRSTGPSLERFRRELDRPCHPPPRPGGASGSEWHQQTVLPWGRWRAYRCTGSEGQGRHSLPCGVSNTTGRGKKPAGSHLDVGLGLSNKVGPPRILGRTSIDRRIQDSTSRGRPRLRGCLLEGIALQEGRVVCKQGRKTTSPHGAHVVLLPSRS